MLSGLSAHVGGWAAPVAPYGTVVQSGCKVIGQC